MSLSERFKRLPEEQLLRNEESSKQAREASEFLKRLRLTREEAENVAKEEIERTRRLQKEEVEMHPEIVDLKKRLSSAEREKTSYERKQRDQEKSFKNEFDTLKREESNLMNKLNDALAEESKLKESQEKIERDREEKEQRLRGLGEKLDNLKREEESQFIGDVKVLKNQIIDLEKRIPPGDTKSRLNQIENELKSLNESRVKTIQEREKLIGMERQVSLDLLKAQQMVLDAKSLESQKQEELNDLKALLPGIETAKKNLFDGELRVKELETSREALNKQKESRQKAIEGKEERIKGIRFEIQRLEKELNDLEYLNSADYNAIYDLENEFNDNEKELREVKERVYEAKREFDFLVSERAKLGKRSQELEREIAKVHQSLKEAEREESRATEISKDINKRCEEIDLINENQSKRIEELTIKTSDLRASLYDFDRINKEIDETRGALNEVQSRWNNWKEQRFRPLQKEFDDTRSWLSSHSNVVGMISTNKSTSLENDLKKVQSRISDLKKKYQDIPINFEDPEKLKEAVRAKESEIWDRLVNRSGPFSQRFMTQLEREAEALMRAEIAATHEIKQTNIEKETLELSKLRLSLNPHVNIDTEARNRLWKSNLESREAGPIADQMMARRLLYFPLLVTEIKRHFGSISRSAQDDFSFQFQEHSSPVSSLKSSKSFGSSDRNENNSSCSTQPSTWFTCNLNDEIILIPLHLPIGLIFDLIQDIRKTKIHDQSSNNILPWKLEFHISNSQTPPAIATLNPSSHFPIEHYNPISDESHLQSFYFSSLKEADHLRCGSAKNVMNLSRAEQIQLWESLRGGDCEKFWRINQKLIGGSSNNILKSLPIKFWIISKSQQSAPSCCNSLSRFQFPVPFTSPSKLLHEFILDEFPNSVIERVSSHGIDLPAESLTLENLNLNLNYADNFINLIIIISKNL